MRECVWRLRTFQMPLIKYARLHYWLAQAEMIHYVCILHHIALIPFLRAKTRRGILQQNSVVLCLGRINSTSFTFYYYMIIVYGINVFVSDDVYAAILPAVNDPRFILKLIM